MTDWYVLSAGREEWRNGGRGDNDWYCDMKKDHPRRCFCQRLLAQYKARESGCRSTESRRNQA